MADPIRDAAERLLQQLELRRTDPDAPLMLGRAESDLRAALEAQPPAAANPLGSFIAAQRPMDPEVAAAVAPETRWDLYESAQPPAAAQKIPEEVRSAFAELERRQRNLSDFRALRESLAVAQSPAPAPASDGEREELAAWFQELGAEPDDVVWIEPENLLRAATLLRHPAPAPAVMDALARLYWWGGLLAEYGYSSDVVVGVRDWINGGMVGDLPPLPAWIADRCPPLLPSTPTAVPAAAPASDGEREELAAWLEQDRGDHGIAAYAETRERLARAATLLRQPPPAPAAVPVAVAERPWEREGWCDVEGRCWWFNRAGIPEWQLADEGPYGDFCLPHWAIPQPPQGGEVQ